MQHKQVEPSRSVILDIRSNSDQTNDPSGPNKTHDKSNSSVALNSFFQCNKCRLSKKLCYNHEKIHKFMSDFKTFTRSQVVEELKGAFENESTLHLAMSAEIRYLSRKYELPAFIVQPILDSLSNQEIDLKIRRDLAQALKYGVKNKLTISFEKLIQVLEGNCAEIKSEIVWALGYKIEHLDMKLSLELANGIKTKMTEDIDPKARSFLKGQMEKEKESDEMNGQVWQGDPKNTNILSLKSKRRAQVMVTKSQQAARVNYKNTESQESQFDMTSITNALGNRQRETQKKDDNKVEKLPEEIQESQESQSTHVSWHRGTYINAKNLYNRAKNGETITEKDKDNYLTDKFFNGVKYLTPGFLGDLITDRIIAATFNIISMKQKLAENIIEKLMLCLNDSRSVCWNYYPNGDTDTFFKNLLSVKIDQTSNDIRKKILQEIQEIKLSESGDKEKMEKAKKFFFREIDFLRRDAISALYNCIGRDKTALKPEYLRKMTICLQDQDKEIQRFAVKILGTLNDSAEIVYVKVFNTCLNHLEENIEIEQSMDYIDQQSKDPRRFKELFTEEVIFRLSCLLKSSTFLYDFRINCNEIIQIYLEHSWAQICKLETLENICSILHDNQEQNELKEKALILLLLAAKKENDFPDSIIESLVKSLESLNDYCAKFAIIILETRCHKKNFKVPCLEKISSKLLDDQVIISQGSTITFESHSSENSSCPAISALAGKIILSGLENKQEVSSEIIHHLTQGLASEQKQTRIYVAKAIFFASHNNPRNFNQSLLEKLEDYVQDEIPDVAINIIRAFTKIYHVLSQENILICPSHMDILAILYADQDLRLNDEDFSVGIQKDILTILANQATKQEFTESICKIFEKTLSSDDPCKKEVLDIMKTYTGNHHRISESTVLAIENVLRMSEFPIQVLDVLEKIAENGQIMSDTILDILAHNLYLNDEEEEIRNKSFKVLELADRNQDLSDGVFEIVEMARAGSGVRSSVMIFHVLEFLEKQTKEGKKLPSNVFKDFHQKLSNSRILSILINVSTNGQILPKFITDKMKEMFYSGANHDELIQIFFNMTKNNQDLPHDLESQLERRLNQNTNADQTLLIFAYRAQKGERLSQDLLKRLYNEFSSTKNSSLKHELLKGFCSVIRTQNDLSQELQILIEKILIGGLHDENENEHIILTSLEGFESLCAMGHLDPESIRALLRKVQLSASQDLKQRIRLLFDSQSLSEQQKIQLKRATLSSEKDLEFLNSLPDFVKNGENFNDLEFQRIDKIINGSIDDSIDGLIDGLFNLQKSAIKLLLVHPKKKYFPGYLVDSLAKLMLSASIELRNQSLLLLGEIAKSGRLMPQKALSYLCELENPIKVLKLIEKNQEIPESAKLLLQIASFSDPAEFLKLAELLKHVVQLDGEFKISKIILQKFFSLAKSCQQNDHTNLQEFALIFSRALLKGFEQNALMITIIEKAIENNKIDLNIVQAYGKLIKSHKCKRLLKCLDSLIEFLLKRKCEEEEDLISLEIFSCLANASTLGNFCQNGLQLMEKNINSPNVKIRAKCFQGLQARKKEGYHSKGFESYCIKLLEKLEIYTGTPVDPKPDLLETLSSLEYWDLGQLNQISQKDCLRELLLSDLLTRLKANEFEKLAFYKEWLETENYLKSNNFDSNQYLKAFAWGRRLTLENIVEILKFFPKIDLNKLNKVNRILLESLNPFEELRQKWLIGLLTECLINQQINKNYIILLASDINSKLATPIISKLFAAISKVDKLLELESLITFTVENKIKCRDIEIKDVSANDLKRFLEIKLLDDRIQSSISREKLITILNNLFDYGWSFEQLLEMFEKVESHSTFEMKTKESLLQILGSLVFYKIPATKNKEILKILDFKVEEWVQKVHKVAIEINFQANSQVRNHVDLVEEYKKDNTNNTYLKKFFEYNPNLSEVIDQIQKTRLLSYVHKGPAISDLVKKNILTWAKQVKLNPKYWVKPESLRIALTYVNEANALQTGFLLSNAQILSCIVLLNADPKKGRLLQVGTGEGKSTIVSVIAIIHALKGKKVDIITSSPVLAERDAREKAGLYKLFGLSCLDNADKSHYMKGPKNCYKQDIVYGEIAQFQFDALRDEYSQLDTRAGRRYEVAIIDEVDSMLIDDSSNIARLSSTTAGMDHLQTFIHFLWHRLNFLRELITTEDGKNYKVSDEARKIPNIEEFAKGVECLKTNGDIEAFLKGQLESYLKDEIIKKEVITVPKNFKEFVEIQTPKWIDNAIRALIMQKDQQYVIQNGVVKPVAFDSTGVVQNATSWGDGLHQFIELKHGLKMTSATLTTNFLSNIGYIKKYAENLFGLTGTLGSKKTQDVLSNVYNVDLAMIPSLYKKRYLQLSTILCKSQSEWLKETCSSALCEANKERGVLIICQTIQDCQDIGIELKKKKRSGAVKLYTMNDMNQERDVQKISPGEIIVATNLAGRGTDIKTEFIEKNGGLHVIVTFLPCNQRVEDQAFGRTARQGKCGTGQMILNRARLLDYGDASTEKIKELRDDFESKMFDQFLKEEEPMVKTKDKLFTNFCNFKQKICQKIKAQTRLGQKHLCFGSSVFETSMLNALEERWALFLHKIDSGKKKDDKTNKKNNQNIIILLNKINEEYNSFENEIFQDLGSDRLIKNPYYHIQIANDLLSYSYFSSVRAFCGSLLEDKDARAAYHLNKARELDPQHSTAALIGKTWLAIKNPKKRVQEKAQLVKELNNSLKFLHDEFAVLSNLQALVQRERSKQQEDSNVDCDLSKQLTIKASILGSYMNSIKHAATAVKKSKRLIDITGIPSDKSRTDLLEVTTFYGLERNQETGQLEETIQEKLGADGVYERFTIMFNDLTMYQDLSNIDQAIETISNVFDSHNYTCDTVANHLIQRTMNGFKKLPALDPKKYKDLTLTLKELNTEKFKILFDPDVHIMDVSKDLALSKLQKYQKCCSVKLDNIVDDQSQEGEKYVKPQEAIKTLKDSNNPQERFNVLLENVNETAMSLQKEILSDSTLILKSADLNYKTAKNKLGNLKFTFKHLHLEISGNRSEIFEALKIETLETNHTNHIGQFASENNETETVNIKKARERIQKIEKEEIWIKIEKLERATAEKIINNCFHASFKITFIGIDRSSILEYTEIESINISFSQLSPSTAQKLIPILRKANMKFILEFHNLNIQQLQDVIQNASLKQEKMEITVKKLSDLFLEKAKPRPELSEFSARGIEYLLGINEKRFTPWRSLATLAFIGALQIVVGALLMTTVAGVTLGYALITESSTEGLMTWKTFSNRHFRWSDYLKLKAVSLVISALSLGCAKVPNGYEAINDVLRGLKREVLEHATTEAITNVHVLAGPLIHAGKELKKVGVQHLVLSKPNLAAEITKKVFLAADHIFHFSLKSFERRISSFVQEKVENIFYVENFKAIIHKMHAFEKITKSKFLSDQIKKIAFDIINPEKSWSRKSWEFIGMRFCKTILWNPSILSVPFAWSNKTLGALIGLADVIELFKSIQSRFLKKLSEIDTENFSIQQLLKKHCKLSPGDAIEVSKILKTEGVILKSFDCEYLNPEVFAIQPNQEQSLEYKGIKIASDESRVKVRKDVEDINFGNQERNKATVMKFCRKLNDETVTMQRTDFSEIMKSISDIITEQIIKVAESHLLSPGSGHHIQPPLSVPTDMQTSRNQDQSKKKDFGIFCFQDLKAPRANSQPANLHSQNQDQFINLSEDQTIIQKMRNHAQQIKISQSAGLADMFSMASQYEIDLKFVEIADYIPTKQEKEQGVKIVLRIQGREFREDKTDHYQLLKSDKGVSRNEKCCGFAVISTILNDRGINISVSELRNQLSKKIEQDPLNYNKLIEAQDWIKKSSNLNEIQKYEIDGSQNLDIQEGQENEPEIPPQNGINQSNSLKEIQKNDSQYSDLQEGQENEPKIKAQNDMENCGNKRICRRFFYE